MIEYHTLLKGLWFGSVFNGLLMMPWVLIFLLTHFMGLRLYHITDREEVKHIQKRISLWCTHHLGPNKGYGYSAGRWYVLYLSTPVEYNSQSAWMIATTASYESFMLQPNKVQIQLASDHHNLKQETMEHKQHNDNKTSNHIVIYERLGPYENSWFKERKLFLSRLTPRPFQKMVMDQIIEHQVQQGRTVAFLYGPPDTGKSIIGLLLADHYRGGYCSTLKPWQPGDTIAEMMGDVDQNDEKTFVLVFDEFDIAMTEIHKGIPPHKKVPISVANKEGWNKMLDEIHWGMFPNLILLLISNKSTEFFDAMDPSYLRKGRVDLKFNMSPSPSPPS